MTGVIEPWLLPRDWEWREFRDVAKIASNLVDPKKWPNEPHIAPNHIESEMGRLLPHSTIADDEVTSPKHRFHAGQLLYSKIRPYLAKVAYVDFAGLCSADMYPIEALIEPRYLQWWMLTREFTRLAANQQARTVLPKINQSALNRLPVPVAPPAEQRRIVEIVEDHVSHLDAADAALSVARARTASLRHQLLWRHITGMAEEGPRTTVITAAECADGQLPSIPHGWRWQRLGDIAEVVGGVAKDAKKQSDPVYVEVPYLRVANVQRGSLSLDNVSTIRVPAVKAEALRLQRGDLLLNEGGDRDKLARGWVWEEQVPDCIHQNHVFRARLLGNLNPYFTAWATNLIGGPWAERNGKQSVNLASISLRMIRRLPVPVPPRATADLIVQKIDDHLIGVTRLDDAIDAALKRREALRRAVLAAAFSGRLTGASTDTEIIEEAAEA